MVQDYAGDGARRHWRGDAARRGYQDALPKDYATTAENQHILGSTITPACSTTPWQLDGAIRALHADGYDDLIPGAQRHGGRGRERGRGPRISTKPSSGLHGLDALYLEDAKWVDFQPQDRMLALDRIYPDGFQIPADFIGKNVLHLPTMKTHVFTTITGAMKNAFGGLLNHNRHWTHSAIHETLVDLLQIQKQIHPGHFPP